MNIEQKYIVKTEKVPGKLVGKTQYVDELAVSIYQKDELGGETKIGSYIRAYPSLYRTFYPFLQDGNEYAMFSNSSASIKVMEMPSCKEIATQPKYRGGFCPVEFYIPYNPKYHVNGHFGFVAGCHWGDDNSWKIQYLDLSKIKEGIVTTDARFGYIQLLDRRGSSEYRTLKDAIDLEYDMSDPNPENHDYRVSIKCEVDFDLRTGEQL